MASRKRKARAARGKTRAPQFEVGQRVEIEGYGAGTVIDVECQRGGRYSDVWVKPDDNPAQEIGVRYQHELVGPADGEHP